ncbi:MAG: acetylxylan esterase, partial [Chloroflexi bacterium HGW-Chloroflexi-8]
GGLTIAVAGLMPEIKVAMPEVPFLCNFQRSVTLINSLPYHEIVNYLRVHRDKEGQVFRTLSYFDGMNFAYRANAKTIFSTALMDETCPPSTVFAAYNYWQGEKEIKVYPYNQHDGGGIDHLYYKINFLRSLWF